VTCWVHAMGRSRAARFSTVSRIRRLLPCSSRERLKDSCANGSRIDIVSPICGLFNFDDDGTSPVSRDAAASSAGDATKGDQGTGYAMDARKQLGIEPVPN